MCVRLPLSMVEAGLPFFSVDLGMIDFGHVRSRGSFVQMLNEFFQFFIRALRFSLDLYHRLVSIA